MLLFVRLLGFPFLGVFRIHPAFQAGLLQAMYEVTASSTLFITTAQTAHMNERITAVFNADPYNKHPEVSPWRFLTSILPKAEVSLCV